MLRLIAPSLALMIAMLPVTAKESSPTGDTTGQYGVEQWDVVSKGFAANKLRWPDPRDWFRRVDRRLNRGGSVEREDGGETRDRCPERGERHPVTAIIPVESLDKSYYTRTISSRPTFLFYIPFRVEEIQGMEFLLFNENEENIELTPYRLPEFNTPGIIKFSLPPESPGLVEEETYRWVLSVICDDDNRSGDIVSNGWISRISTEVDLYSIEQLSFPEQLQFYSDETLWHETLTVLANHQDQETMRETWNELLNYAGLEHLSDQPILD
ncbi:MAG: DUF928 domain-containing protein [Cyanobacteria bacterium P01_E01_bin.6]